MLFEFDDGAFVKAGDLAEPPTIEIMNDPVKTELCDGAGHWKAGVSLVTDVIVVDSAWLCFSTERNQQAEIKASAPLALPAPSALAILPAVPAEALKAIAGPGTLTASATAATARAICTTLPNGGTPLARSIKLSRTWLGLGTPELDAVKDGAEEFVQPVFPAVDAD